MSMLPGFRHTSADFFSIRFPAQPVANRGFCIFRNSIISKSCISKGGQGARAQILSKQAPGYITTHLAQHPALSP